MQLIDMYNAQQGDLFANASGSGIAAWLAEPKNLYKQVSRAFVGIYGKRFVDAAVFNATIQNDLELSNAVLLRKKQLAQLAPNPDTTQTTTTAGKTVTTYVKGARTYKRHNYVGNDFDGAPYEKSDEESATDTTTQNTPEHVTTTVTGSPDLLTDKYQTELGDWERTYLYGLLFSALTAASGWCW